MRRLLYDEIVDMKRFPNFKGAKILGFCLNVMGLTASRRDYDKDSRALQRATLAWTKRNFVWLHGYNPRVAERLLGGRPDLRRSEPMIGSHFSHRRAQARTQICLPRP